MGKIKISLPEESERILRRIAKEKYGGKKGSLSKVAAEAVRLL